jgi:hypothetical protein
MKMVRMLLDEDDEIIALASFSLILDTSVLNSHAANEPKRRRIECGSVIICKNATSRLGLYVMPTIA